MYSRGDVFGLLVGALAFTSGYQVWLRDPSSPFIVLVMAVLVGVSVYLVWHHAERSAGGREGEP